MNRRLGALSLALPLLIVKPAKADDGCTGLPSVIELLLEVDPPDLFIAQTLERHLRGELRARQIGVCTTLPEGTKPIARVRLQIVHSQAGPVLATLEVRDEITDKSLERVLKLTHLPADARPLAVATSADELLRASWVELTIPDAPAPAMPPPAAVLRAVEASRPVLVAPGLPPPKSAAARFEIGLAATATAFRYRTSAGTRASGTLWWHPRIGTGVHAEGSLGATRGGQHGSAAMNALGGGLDLTIALTPRTRPLGLEAGVSTSVHQTRTAGEASEGNRQFVSAGTAVVAGAGFGGWMDLSRMRLHLGLCGLLPLRPVRASDDSRELTSIAGPAAEGSLGIAVLLP